MKKQRREIYPRIDNKMNEILAKIDEIIAILDRMISDKRKFNAEMAERYRKRQIYG